jgi:hypothetical protein
LKYLSFFLLNNLLILIIFRIFLFLSIYIKIIPTDIINNTKYKFLLFLFLCQDRLLWLFTIKSIGFDNFFKGFLNFFYLWTDFWWLRMLINRFLIRYIRLFNSSRTIKLIILLLILFTFDNFLWIFTLNFFQTSL